MDEIARLVEKMIDEPPFCDHLWARCALAMAASTIRHGRSLTDQEKLENLNRALRGEFHDPQ